MSERGDLQGWLFKQSSTTPKVWRQKYVVLKKKDGLLLQYSSDQDAKPRRIIDLRKCKSVAVESSPTDVNAPLNRRIRIKAPQEDLVLCAENDEIHAEWSSALAQSREASRMAKEGYLSKQGFRVKSWKRRWFVLKSRQLLYYKSQEDVDESQIQGVIDLNLCTFIGTSSTEGSKTGHPNSFLIETPDRTFVLSADTPEERDEWLTVLTFHPDYPSSTVDRSRPLSGGALY